MATVAFCCVSFILIIGKCRISSASPSLMGSQRVSENSHDDKFRFAEVQAFSHHSVDVRESKPTYFIRSGEGHTLSLDNKDDNEITMNGFSAELEMLKTEKMAGINRSNRDDNLRRRLYAASSSDAPVQNRGKLDERIKELEEEIEKLKVMKESSVKKEPSINLGAFIDNIKMKATPTAAKVASSATSSGSSNSSPGSSTDSSTGSIDSILSRNTISRHGRGTGEPSSSSDGGSGATSIDTYSDVPAAIKPPAANKIMREVAPDLKHQSKGEKEYLALHKCRDSGEAYGAAYLITKQHLIDQNTGYNLTWVNCEMGSFIMMNGRANPQREDLNGTIIQTLDVLDFSVIHLSAYERLIRRWHKSLPKSVDQSSIEPITKSAEYLQKLASADKDITQKERPEYSRTVVIMPFLGSDMGAGHSKLNNRLQYLRACFWSMYRYFPYIVAYVKSDKDLEFAKHSSGLPFHDVVINKDLPKSASLPVSTVQRTKEFIMNGTWDFDFVLFTESDQILMLRNPQYLYDHLAKYPRRIIIPHRLMPYPESILTYHHKRPIHIIDYQRSPPTATSYREGGQNLTDIHLSSAKSPIPSTTTDGAWIANSPGGGPLDWTNFNCCLARQNCMDRKGWIHVRTPNVPVINAFGLQVPLGNTNFHEESYRSCILNTAGDWSTCP